jgi:amino acid adenylation domain-containing protein
MQQGMLFHTVSVPGSDVYVQQLACVLRGELQASAFRTAWETILERHAPLRTAFAWTGLPEPLQVVGRRVRLPLESLDWHDVPIELRAERLAMLRQDGRRRGFDLARAPLMRLTLVRLSDDTHHLIWTWHHTILDAWSVPVILEEVFAAYDALCEGRLPALAAVRPYGDFIAWLRTRDRAGPEGFWRGQLDGFTAPTPLGLGTESVGGDDSGYGLEFLEVPAEEISGMRAAARAAGVTLNTVVQGAWALLLGRYCGQREVLFGTAVAGRPPELAGIETMVGLFINTLPVRVRIDPTTTLPAWLQALQQIQVEVRRHEHTPLADIQGWSCVPHGRPLFESLLVVEDFSSHRLRLSGGGLTLGDIDFVERAHFPLTVLMAVRDRSVLGVGFDRDRFDVAEMRRLLVHLRSLLTAMARGSDRQLAELDHLDPDERRLFLEEWSRAQQPVPDACRRADQAISRLFEEQVRRSPDAPAAIFRAPEGDVTLSYRALNAQANQLAWHLRGFGVGPEERAAICMEASLARLLAVLAVLKAGGAYVPLDPTLPTLLLQELIADCEPRVVLTQPGLTEAFSGIHAAPILALAEDWARTAKEPAENLPDGATPDNAAYLIYTSGSTGRRKGVVVTHTSLRRLVEAQLDAFRIGPHSRILQFASFSFDASVSEIFTALLAGARLYMAPRKLLLPSAEMMTLLDRWEIDTVTLPPSVLFRLPAAKLPALRTLIAAGETCPAELVTRWGAGRLFLNAYGPTEATVCATVAAVLPDGVKPSIGRPVGEARVYILDDDMNPVSIGVTGQLHIGGPGVSRGYWRRPDLTAAAFVPDPFSGEPGSRLYRTGDLARFRPDGNIEYLGRLDDQIKIRGFRVELGEIEAILREQPSIREAAVLAVGDSGDNRRLVAFVVPAATEDTRAPRPEWWPSIAEFFVYDELAYYAMASDERRNRSYRAAIDAQVPGRVVLEVGTGPEALLSRFCAEAGARKIYAIEKLEDSFRKARARVRELELEDRITVLHGDAAEITLPEPAEVCVSEIVGSIGGSEGAAVITNNVRRLLVPGARMIPERSVTLYAPVQLPDALLDRPGFGPLAARYADKIFAEVGRPFDLRLCVRGLDRSSLLGAARPFEDFDYRGPVEPEYRFETQFELERSGRFDGFLVWLTLDTGAGKKIDILNHEHCWLPVFFPASHPGQPVAAGDRIEAACGAVLCEDGLHSDYFIEGRLHRGGSEPVFFRHDAPRHARVFRDSPFHHAFFKDGAVPRVDERAPAAGFDGTALRERLRRRTPAHMVPSTIVPIDRLPLTSSGKLDRRALLASAGPGARAPPAPRNETEILVARIWRDVLGLSAVDIRTNFFEHGGHSLLLLEVQDRIQKEADRSVEITDLFRYPTVESLALHLAKQRDANWEPPTEAASGGQTRASARQEALTRVSSRRVHLGLGTRA